VQSQAQEVVTQSANERGSIAEPVIEDWPSDWEMGRGAEVVLAAGEALAMCLESALGGASRKAPGGAEYAPPALAAAWVGGSVVGWYAGSMARAEGQGCERR